MNLPLIDIWVSPHFFFFLITNNATANIFGRKVTEPCSGEVKPGNGKAYLYNSQAIPDGTGFPSRQKARSPEKAGWGFHFPRGRNP